MHLQRSKRSKKERSTMKPRMIVLLAVLMLTSLPALRAVCLQGKEAATPCEAAFGFESFRLGGVFGRRVENMIKGILLRLDMERELFWLLRNTRSLGRIGASGRSPWKTYFKGNQPQPCNPPSHLS